MRIPGLVVAAGGAGLAAWLVRAGRPIPEAMGGRASGARATRMQASPAWSNGRFHNQQLRFEPSARTLAGSVKELITQRQERHPVGDVPVVHAAPIARPEGLHVTWLGHSTVLVQVDGVVVLLDPMWSDRCSPSQQVGPRRIHPVPCALTELPPVDVVVISHDHYDHLDMDSVKELARLRPDTRFVVPLGVGAHLEKWGIPADRIDELDWHEDTKVGGVRLVATPAQHFSGRGLSRDGTLWASWVVEGGSGKVFYSGDTGYFIGFAEVGERYGPFDVALVQVGAYDPGWPTIHMTPEHGVEAALDVGAAVMVPVHWATFNLAFHPWSEPIERLLVEAERRGMRVAIPRPGEQVAVAQVAAEPTYWWRSVT